jgi:hypothetical protein
VTSPPHLSETKRAKLSAFFGSLPGQTAARVFAALEHDRARGGKGLPHDDLIEELRVELLVKGAAFPPRAKSSRRLFFEPFEDLFVLRHGAVKRRGRIARDSLNKIWETLLEDPACAEAQRAVVSVDLAIAQAGKASDAAVAALHEAARLGFSKLVAHADREPGFRAGLAERLGADAALYDFGEVHLLLGVVGKLKELQRLFVKPVAGFTEEELFELRRLYKETRDASPDAAPYLLLALLGRMETPWRALRAYYHLARARDETLGPAERDAAVIVDTLFEDLEAHARGLERETESEFDGEAASISLRHFAEFAEGMAVEARRAGDAETIRRIDESRNLAAESLARFAELSQAAIRRMMPTRHAGGSSRLMALRPDYLRPPAPGAYGAARAAASFLAASGDLALKLGRPTAVEGMFEDAAKETRRYAGDLVSEIRAAEGEERLAARRLMDQVLDLAEAMMPEGDVELMRQKAHAAAVSA